MYQPWNSMYGNFLSHVFITSFLLLRYMDIYLIWNLYQLAIWNNIHIVSELFCAKLILKSAYRRWINSTLFFFPSVQFAMLFWSASAKCYVDNQRPSSDYPPLISPVHVITIAINRSPSAVLSVQQQEHPITPPISPSYSPEALHLRGGTTVPAQGRLPRLVECALFVDL